MDRGRRARRLAGGRGLVLLSAAVSAGALDPGASLAARVLVIGGGMALGQFFLERPAPPLRERAGSR